MESRNILSILFLAHEMYANAVLINDFATLEFQLEDICKTSPGIFDIMLSYMLHNFADAKDFFSSDFCKKYIDK